MNTNWKYPLKVPNTRDKDDRNSLRKNVRAAGVARGSGIKQVDTSSGTAIFVLPQKGRASSNAAPSWV